MSGYRKSKATGTILYYLLWPLVWIYAPLKVRVRVILIHENQIVVVKNWFGPNTWQLPGGGVKTGESATLTAVREIQEELGIKLDDSILRVLTQSVHLVRAGGVFYRYHYVLCELDVKGSFIVSHGITDMKWTPFDSVIMPVAIRSRIA